MGGFKESLNDLEIYRLQSNSGQSIHISSFSNSEGRTSPFERRYLAKRQKEKEESTRASNLNEENSSANKPTDQKLPANQASLEQLASHFNSNLKKKKIK
jgi:hypothetical protein